MTYRTINQLMSELIVDSWSRFCNHGTIKNNGTRVMYKIAREFFFDASHMLDNHHGKCKNLHGHTYRLVVEIEGTIIKSGSSSGMVTDFSAIKTLVEKQLIQQLDHAFLYDQTNENEKKIANLLLQLQRKVFAFPYCTTAELMSHYIYNHLSHFLPVSMIKLWETPRSYCEYRGR